MKTAPEGLSPGRLRASACSRLPGNHSASQGSREPRRRIHVSGSLRRLARGHISMVNRCRKPGNCIFRGIPRCRCRCPGAIAWASAPGYRRVRALGAAGLGAAGLGVAAGLLGGVRDAGDAEVLSRGACCAHPRRPDAVKPPLRDLAWSSGAAERGVGACNGPLRMFYVGWLRRVWLGATVGGSAAGAAGAP